MINRLPDYTKIAIIGCFLTVFTFSVSRAQTGAFTFSYPGPTQIAVGDNCDATLAGKLGTPVVTSVLGASITMSMYDSVATGFGLYDPNPPGTYTLSWFVKDDAGRSATFVFNVTLRDATPPVLDLSGTPPLLQVASIRQVPPMESVGASDNCTPTANIIRSFNSTVAPDLCKAGTFTRTWTATDQAGNSTTFVQTVQVSADTDPPVISTLPQGATGVCPNISGGYATWIAAQRANFSATDPSGILSYTDNAPAVYPFPVCPASVTVVFRATDNCNIFSTASATFTAADNAAPLVVSPPKDTVAFCHPDSSYVAKLGEFIHRHGYAQVTDNCTSSDQLQWIILVNTESTPRDSAAVVAAFFDSFANAPCGFQSVGGKIYNKVRGHVRIDLFVKDRCDKQTFVGKAYFILRDTTGPSLTGTTRVESCGGGNDQTALQTWINAHGNALVKDGCSTVTWTNFSYTTSGGQTGNGSFNAGPYPVVSPNQCSWHTDVTFRATDDCGNTSSVILRFEVRDTTAPLLTIAQPNITVYCPDDAPSSPPPPALTDNCDPAPTVAFVRQTIADPVPACLGNYTVRFTWTATDQCGNTRTAIQNYIVRDTTGPVFTQVPAEKTFRCDTFVLPAAPVAGINIAASDECSPIQSITTRVTSGKNPDPTACSHYNYEITRIFTATDGCGNTRTATQLLRVTDNLPPVFSGQADTTLLCSVPPALPMPVANDACSGPAATLFIQSSNDVPGNCPDAYTRTLIWQAADVCGNTARFTQTITVIDTLRPVLSGTPPNITVNCQNIPSPPAVTTFTATDNCDNDVTVVLNTTEIRPSDVNACDYYHNYLIRRTWTATDNCGNSTARTQTITVIDDTPPQLVLPASLTLPTDAAQCAATVPVPAPVSLYDQCTGQATVVQLADTLLLTNSSGTFNSSLPVSPLLFSWATSPANYTQAVLGTPTLTVFLDNVDANQTSEFFKITVEGDSIGRTGVVPGANSCVNNNTLVTVSAAQMNRWLSDGQLNMTLTTNGTGSNAINYVGGCTGVPPRVRAVWSFTKAVQKAPVTLTYQIDTLAVQSYTAGNTAVLSQGSHTIRYTARDCVGNSTSAVLTVLIEDKELPVVTPPATQTGYTAANNCTASGPLPFPVISENCALAGQLAQSSPVSLLTFENDPDAGEVPVPVNMTVSGLLPNAIGNGVLKILFKGDNAGALEYFTIRDENNNVLQNTTSGLPSEECKTFHETRIPVTAAQINQWAANGVTTFNALPNRTFGSAANELINPCAPLNSMGQDGQSAIQAVLEYNYAIVQYDILSAGNVILQSGVLTGSQTTYNNLAPGSYTVRYRTSDRSGNTGQAQYSLMVRDTVRPVAKCKLVTTINTDASGLLTDTLRVNAVNNGSTDNCTQLTYQLSRNVFTCDDADAPAPIPVTMTVRDGAGNTSVCTTLVEVKTPVLMPTYNNGVCEQGALFLNSNVPLVQGVEAYNYKWYKPGNIFFSTDKDPVIPNTGPSSEGVYRLEITAKTNISGCASQGTVDVDLTNLPGQPIITSDKPQYCAGDPIVLSTTKYGGTKVTYKWFLRTAGSDIEVQSNDRESYPVQGFGPGTYRFFVKVISDGCASINSTEIVVQVFPIPVAEVREPTVRACVGQPIAVGTNTFGPSMTWTWTGPDGFMSDLQNPPVIPAASLTNAGPYILLVRENGCVSQPDTTFVTVDVTPPAPQITGPSKVCKGASLSLVCQPPNATSYYWLNPSLIIEEVTFINSFSLDNIDVDKTGDWRVYADIGGCKSALSAPFRVEVQPFPIVTIDSLIQKCGGDTLRLRPTANMSNLEWEWSGPGNFMSFQQNIDRPTVAGIYRVIARLPQFGCADTAVTRVKVVNPPSIKPFTTTAEGCFAGNTNATITAHVISEAPPLSYIWNLPSNPNPIVQQDSVLTLTNVTSTLNGNYMLTVKNAAGCVSQSRNILINNILDIPTQPIVVATPNVVCPGEIFEVNITNSGAYNGRNPKYFWTTPRFSNGISASPQLQFLQTTKVDSGLYWVRVVVDTCSSTSVPVHVRIKTTPLPPVISAEDKVLCAGETLRLRAATLTNAQYEWSALPPNQYTSTVQNPEIMSVDTANSGAYRAVVIVEGCRSAPSDTIVVKINPGVRTPFAQPPFPVAVCKQQPTSVLRFKVGTNTATPGAQYQWIHVATNTQIAPPSTDTVLNLTVATMPFLEPGVNEFYVVAIKNGCSSAISNRIQLRLDTIPAETAYAGVDFIACAESTIRLNATAPAAGTGIWSLQQGPLDGVLVSPSTANTIVTGLQAGREYYYQWKLSNGACRDYSTDVVKVTVNAFDPPRGGPDRQICSAGDNVSATLTALRGTNPTGRWTQPSGQIFANVKILQPDSFTTTVTNMYPGKVYYFIWTLADVGCGPASDTVSVRVFTKRAYGGPDQPGVCNTGACVTMNATEVTGPGETAFWSVPPGSVLDFDRDNHQTNLCNLQPGSNIIYWNSNPDVCGADSRDTVVIIYEKSLLKNDTFPVLFGSNVTGNVLTNDNLIKGYKFNGLPNVSSGSLQPGATEGSFIYTPRATFSGSETIIYQVCSGVCINSCEQASVTFVVGDPGECFIPSLITPNDDGINDSYIIPPSCFINGEGVNIIQVSIYNQWGDLIYHSPKYDNNAPWNGRNSGNEELPAGTYFYIVQIGDQEPYKGFIVLQR